MKHFAYSLTAVALAAAVGQAQAVTFSTFVSGGDLASVLSNNATIGFAYAGDKFVGSVYYGANNNQLYSTDLSGGSVAKFGAPIPGFYGEVYVSSSLGIGGYGPRDIYAGSEGVGSVYRIAHDGSSQGVFASGLTGGVRSIAFDPYGLYGNNMVVATNAGSIYRIDSAGAASLLANVGEDAEGLSFAPQNFGGYAKGTLFVASEGSGSLRAISPSGTVNTVISGLYGAEMVSFVPLNLGTSGDPVEGFYAASYAIDVQKAAAADFVPYKGHAVITGETGHQVWDVAYDVGLASFTATQIGTFPAQPEDGIFVTKDIIRPAVPEPEVLAMVFAGLGVVAGTAFRRRRQV